MSIAVIMTEMCLVVTMEEQLGQAEAKYQLKPPEAYMPTQWYAADQNTAARDKYGIVDSNLSRIQQQTKGGINCLP